MGQRIPVTLGNIAPLSLRPFQPGRIALVCEGGGQRGIFTAGVLDEFMRAQFNPFDLYLGTSAGAQNLSAYICNQPGYARKVIMRYTTKREFFDPLRFVRGGNLIDLDWLDVIRASSAIPGFYRSGVSLEGINYLDGGISDAIPVKEAARQGAKTLVVIRTVPSQMYYTPQWFKRMERWLGDSSLQPLVNLVQHHETSYREIQQFIEKPPGQLRIFEIYPPKPLHSIALGSRIPALREDYKLGRLCGRYFLATVGKLLTEKAPLSRHLVPVVTPESIVIPPAPVANDTLVAEVSDAPQANDPTFNNEDLA